MEYHILEGLADGHPIEKRCSRLILGTAHFFQFNDKQRAFNIMDEYITAGGNMFDTAHQYIDSEVILGDWIEKRGNRAEVFILTKGGHPDDGQPGNRVNPRSITKDLIESLQRLKTDYIDFYALHRDDPDVEVGPIIEVLNQHISAGRVHSIGVSNWDIKRIQEANNYAQAHGLTGFTFNSPNLSLAQCNEPRWPGCVSIDEASLEWHKGNQLPLLSWSSQAGGFFSGRFLPYKEDNEEMVRVYYNENNWERFRRAEWLAGKKAASATQIALSYVLNQPFPVAAIIGPETSAELFSSIEGANIQLSEEEISFLELKISSIRSDVK